MMTLKKALMVMIATSGLSSAALAISINQNPQMTQKDTDEIALLEQSTFDLLEKSGTEQLFRNVVADVTPEMVRETQKIDKACGKALEVQSFKTEFRGSRFAEKWYLSIHEGCMLHWKISFARERATWELRNLDFNTDPQPM